MPLGDWMVSSTNGVIHEHYVAVGQHRLRYLKAGSGPSLVLLHGLMGSANCWGETIPALAAQSTVYALDSLGNGDSDRSAEAGADLESTVERTIGFMDAAGISKADILGTSHGGAVSMVLAARHPERVRSLVLHAPANPFSNIADPIIAFYGTRLGIWFAHRIPTLPARVQEIALGRMYGNPALVKDGTVERYMDQLQVVGTIDHSLKILHGWSHDMKVLGEALPALRQTPIHLIWGTKDKAVSVESAYELTRIFEVSSLTLLPQTGHVPYEEIPAQFSREVNRYLDTQKREEEAIDPPLSAESPAA